VERGWALERRLRCVSEVCSMCLDICFLDFCFLFFLYSFLFSCITLSDFTRRWGIGRMDESRLTDTFHGG
jgi:hypothetical protein